MEVYKRQYRPFVMGGPVNRFIKCDVEAQGPHDLGGGYEGYVVTSPDGKTTFVAEATTGAIVGGSLKMVRDDIAVADPQAMAEQVAQATQDRETAQPVELAEFWG